MYPASLSSSNWRFCSSTSQYWKKQSRQRTWRSGQLKTNTISLEGASEGVREGWRAGGGGGVREGESERERERGSKGGTEREGVREREGGREGRTGREGVREGGREGGSTLFSEIYMCTLDIKGKAKKRICEPSFLFS